MLDEVLHHFQEAPTAGESEGCLLCLLRLAVDVSSVLHQQRDHLLVTLPRRLHQWSVAGGDGRGGEGGEEKRGEERGGTGERQGRRREGRGGTGERQGRGGTGEIQGKGDLHVYIQYRTAAIIYETNFL